ncbi:MAG: N-acetylmuramate/N-acetylglucosamine kinase [Holosporales bacterium]
MNEFDRLKKRTDFAKKTPHFLSVSFLASDMSKRKYYRVQTQDSSYVLMDAEDLEELNRYIKIQSYLISMGVKAPRTYNQDLENGFLLIEDFKDTSLTKALSDPFLKKDEYEYYLKAIKILHKIQENYNAITYPLDDYSLDVSLKEASIFCDFYFPLVHKKNADDLLKKEWCDLWQKALLEPIDKSPNTLVLRDYHVDNILLLNDASLGILDFQDALLGSILYDYISLVEDARRKLDDPLIQKLTNDFLCVYDSSKHQDYLYFSAIIGACRHAKVLGVFARYALFYKNDSKLCFVSHVLNLLINALKRSEQTELLYFLKDQGFLK